MYKKGRWNVSHFSYADGEVEEAPPLPRLSESDYLEDTADEAPEMLDQDVEAAWAAGSNDSPPSSDSETETEEDTDSDDRANDPDYAPGQSSSSSDSDASEDSGPNPSATDLPKKTVSSERQYARFLNTLVSVLHTFVSDPRHSYPIIHGHRIFSAAFSTVPIFHALGPRKPDLIIIESRQERLLDDISWEDPKIVMELTKEEYKPTSRIAYTIHSKAYLMLRSQPWRRFILGLSIARDLLRIHYYDRSGAIVSRPINIHEDPRRAIRVISAAAFADRSYIGFDPTIEISPPQSVEKPPSACATSSDAQHQVHPPGPSSDTQHPVLSNVSPPEK